MTKQSKVAMHLKHGKENTMKVTESKEYLEWCTFQRHLMAIEQVIFAHGFSWCSDDYPVIEILDCEGINTLAVFKFTSFDQLERELKCI